VVSAQVAVASAEIDCSGCRESLAAQFQTASPGKCNGDGDGFGQSKQVRARGHREGLAMSRAATATAVTTRVADSAASPHRGFGAGLLLALVAIEGAASLGIEVVALRRIVPYVGSSITITAPTIAAFLAALALGYHRAAQVQGDFERRVLANFVAAAAIAGVGLSAEFAALIFLLVPDRVAGLAVYLGLTMLPPAYLLAQTVPLLTNVMRSSRAGESAGRALAWSTAGSVVSAAGLSLIVMQMLGVRWAVVAAAAPMALVALVAASKVGATAIAVRAVCTLAAIVIVNTLPGSVTETAYADYRVVTSEWPAREGEAARAVSRVFVVNSQAASQLDGDAAPRRAAYIEFMAAEIRRQAADRTLEVLVLGAGGFTLSVHLRRYRSRDPRHGRTAVPARTDQWPLCSGRCAPVCGRFQ
jgi:hypothetical protein